MATRTISGVLRKPISNDLWTGAAVTFRLTNPFSVAGASYPTQAQEVTSHATTAVITVVLAVPTSGTARYECVLPDKRNFTFYLAAGEAVVSFESLVQGAFAEPVEADELQTLVDTILATANAYTDAHAAVKASAGGLGHVRVGDNLSIDGDGVLSAPLGVTSDQRAGLDAANNPDGSNPFATMGDLGVLDNDLDTLGMAVGAHIANVSNPHSVTPAQIGAQPLDGELTALAGLTSAADKLPYFTGAGTAGVADFSAFARTLLDDANQGAMQTTLGLVPGTNVQAFDAELSAIAGLTSAADKGVQFTGAGAAGTFDLTAAGKALLDDANAAAQRATMGARPSLLVESSTAADPYTLLAGDQNEIVRVPGTVIIPDTLDPDEGALFELQASATGVNVITEGGAVISSANDRRALLAAEAEARLRYRGSGRWALSGELLDTWADVAEPDAAFGFVPFTVQQNGRRFRVDPAFDLQTHANITVAATYYVDKSTGNDANTGADWANALRTLSAALLKADVDRVYVRNSTFTAAERGAMPNRDVELIGVGDDVWLTADLSDLATGSWSLVDSHYERVFGSSAFVSAVVDMATVDADGNPQRLTSKASIAEVDANPGSFYFNYTPPNSSMYVHLSDGRSPDSDVYYLGSATLTPDRDNRKYYIENCKFLGGLRLRNATATGGLLVYLKDLRIVGPITTAGVTELITERVSLWASGDGHNIDARNTVVSNVIEIDCKFSNSSTSTSDQASTGHNACNIIRINGRYHDAAGQCIADVTSCNSWLLGAEMHTSRVNDVGFYMDGEAWLDCCYIHDVTTDIEAAGAGTTVHTRDLISGGTFAGAGTVVAY